jgi:uncharacterized iron-regulated protein
MRTLAALVGLTLALAVGGCGTATPGAEQERIVDLRRGRTISRAELLEAARGADVVLLGERHDNARHHAARGALLESLGAPAAVVAEHLPAGARVRFGGDLLASLQAAGFEAKAWRWPLHEALFAGVARAGLPLEGGNLPREEVRRIAREGESALPAQLAPLLAGAPLDAAAQAALDADLIDGHCGQLDAKRLPGLRAAQRARDASMLAALRKAGAAPAVLLAGNGHVRLDYGVGQLLAVLQPQARVLSVGFLEAGEPVEDRPYTHVWITPRAERSDPCAGFTMPAAR